MPEDECLIEAEPMFCFETAVKLLYWSGFVYEDDEVTSQTEKFVSPNIKNLSIKIKKTKSDMFLGVVTMLGVARKGLMLLYWSGFVYLCV